MYIIIIIIIIIIMMSEVVSLLDSRRNFVHNIIKILHLTLNMFLYANLWKINYNCYQFQRHIARETSELSCKIGYIQGHRNISHVKPMTIKSEKQCNSAQKRIRDVKQLKQWMIDA